MLKRFVCLMVIMLVATGCGVKAKTYIMTKERVDIEPKSPNAEYETGNAGYIFGAPQFKEPERKTRKIYVLEMTKALPEGEVKKIEQEVTASSTVNINMDAGQSDSQSQEDVQQVSRKIVIPKIDDEDSLGDDVMVKNGNVKIGPTENTVYKVVKDDTLQKIAKKFYGSYSEWIRIYNANKEKIKNPNVLRPGTEITIPAVN